MQTSPAVNDLILARLKGETVSILVILLLLGGLGVVLYLNQQSQSLRSRAQESGEVFMISDQNDKPLLYSGNNIYKTNTLKIRIRVRDTSSSH